MSLNKIGFLSTDQAEHYYLCTEVVKLDTKLQGIIKESLKFTDNSDVN